MIFVSKNFVRLHFLHCIACVPVSHGRQHFRGGQLARENYSLYGNYIDIPLINGAGCILHNYICMCMYRMYDKQFSKPRGRRHQRYTVHADCVCVVLFIPVVTVLLKILMSDG